MFDLQLLQGPSQYFAQRVEVHRIGFAFAACLSHRAWGIANQNTTASHHAYSIIILSPEKRLEMNLSTWIFLSDRYNFCSIFSPYPPSYGR